VRCAAILATQYRFQQPWVKQCEQQATMLGNGIPLCGTHINHKPDQVVCKMSAEIWTTEKLP
jgi:hypothetical protein